MLMLTKESNLNEAVKKMPEKCGQEDKNTDCCCGQESPPKIDYRNIPVEGKININGREIDKVSANWRINDYLGEIMVRLGFLRMNYAVKPGIYAMGNPDTGSAVMVCANYKLSFDILRKELNGLNVWFLIIDTKGVNVWCAAGKGTFGTKEVVKRIMEEKLSEIVAHKNLILPQLSAPGVSCHMVKMLSEFNVIYGPIRAEDIKSYMQNGMKADNGMRRVRFDFKDRLNVMWFELMTDAKTGLIGSSVLILLALLFPSFASSAKILSFSFWLAIFIGACLAPLALPYLPGRAFSLKGGFLGLIALPIPMIFFKISMIEIIYSGLIICALSAYLTVNFTGASTYTSLSGVKKELKYSIPAIIAFLLIAVILLIVNLSTGRNI